MMRLFQISEQARRLNRSLQTVLLISKKHLHFFQDLKLSLTLTMLMRVSWISVMTQVVQMSLFLLKDFFLSMVRDGLAKASQIGSVI